MSKKEELELGKKIIEYFCNLNNMHLPKIIVTNKIAGAGYYQFDKPDTLFIDLKKCDKMTIKNHPAMIYENTVIGTLLHEFGHYIHFRYFPKLTQAWRKFKTEPHIHYHEREINEDIAECIRIYILLSPRLYFGRPERNAQLDKIFNNPEYMSYCPMSIFTLYDKKHEKVDIDDWESFLV